jgi:hypothetical protein
MKTIPGVKELPSTEIGGQGKKGNVAALSLFATGSSQKDPLIVAYLG